MDVGSYVDTLFQKAERAKQWEEYKFTPMYERVFYVRGLPIQNFGAQHTFTIAEVNALVSEQIGTQNISFPFNFRLSLEEGLHYFNIGGFEEWGKFMEGTLGDMGPKSDFSDEEIYTFHLSPSKQKKLDDLEEVKIEGFGAGSETQHIREFENDMIYIPPNPALDSCFFQCITKEFELLPKAYHEDL